MLIEISYPGQEVRVVKATSNIVRHFRQQGWDLPFICIVDDEGDLSHNTVTEGAQHAEQGNDPQSPED